MGSLEDFVGVYIGVVLETIQENGLLGLDDFYSYVFVKVSERTGLSKKEVKYLHHAFHWNLFLRSYSPLELVPSQENGENYEVRLKKSLPEKSELVAHILKENRKWLEARLKNLKQL